MGAFDLNDYTAETWTMTDAGGHVITSVRIRIESRAWCPTGSKNPELGW